MLCPEVINFPPPKVITFSRRNQSMESVIDTIKINTHYKSVVITCPDELHPPSAVEELLVEDTEYYQILNCPLSEFVDATFIESFVKRGSLHCLSADKNCIIDNCAAISPNGILTLHVLDYVFQTLGFEGRKRQNNYYEVNIDLKNIRKVEKVCEGLNKLESMNFNLIWEPHIEDVCPSSIAKYFHDRKYKVLLQPVDLKRLSPSVESIPSIKDVEVDEMVEWIGMLAIQGDLAQDETYISTYSSPESDYSIESKRVSVLIVKGMFTSTLLSNICKKIAEYINTRDLDNFWSSISIQSSDSLWQWSQSSPRMFQAQDCSTTIIFTKDRHVLYSIGQLKYT